MAINEPMGGPNRLRRAAEGTARKSGARAALFWAFALVAGLGTALVIAKYLDKSGGGASPVTKIVVAATDLPLAAKIGPQDVRLDDWPKDHLPPGVATDPKELVGRILISRILAGELLLEAKLAPKDAKGGLAALIPSTMRAVAVRVDDVVGVAGFIHPDDRVDVLVTLRPQRPGAETTSKVFMQNVKVLAVGQEVETADRSRLHATPATVATLLVSPSDAERLTLAQAEGRLILTLRSWTDSQPVDTAGASPSGLIDAPVAAAGAPAAAAPQQHVAMAGRRGRGGKNQPQQPPAVLPTQDAPKPDVVEILRGDRFEQRNFKRGDNR